MSAPFSPDNRPKVGQQYKSTKTGKVYTVDKVYTLSILLSPDKLAFNGELTNLLVNGTLIRI